MLGHPEPDHLRAITRLASPSDSRAESALGAASRRESGYAL